LAALRALCHVVQEQTAFTRGALAASRSTMDNSYALLAETGLRLAARESQLGEGRIARRFSVPTPAPRPMGSWPTDDALSPFSTVAEGMEPTPPLEIVIVGGAPGDARAAVAALPGVAAAHQLHVFSDTTEAGQFLLREGDYEPLPSAGSAHQRLLPPDEADHDPPAAIRLRAELPDLPLTLMPADRLAPPVPQREAMLPALAEPMTALEFDVLVLLASRLSTTEIAATLRVSWQTVARHTDAIYQKLRVTNRRAAVERAAVLGVLAVASAEVAPPTRCLQPPVPLRFGAPGHS
jgi:DNA-binding CsgD family transcriptional regulator